MSSRPFVSSRLSIVDRVRQVRPNLTQNEQIIEKNTKVEKVQFECIEWHYLYILAQQAKQIRSINTWTNTKDKQDNRIEDLFQDLRQVKIFVKILLQDLSDTREISKCKLTWEDVPLPIRRFSDVASKMFE